MKILFEHVRKRTTVISVLLSLTFCEVGCKKFLEIDAPKTSINDENVYGNDAIASSVLTGIYTRMSSSFLSASISFNTGLSSDELELVDLNNTEYFQVFTNSLVTPQFNGSISDFWSRFYPVIFTVNSAIEGLSGSNSLTPQVKNQLLGEAKFVRAFSYFFLVNFYGDVPLALSSDYKVNSRLPRTEISKVYQQIIADLTDAQSLLNEDYVGADATSTGGAIERVRPNKSTATALLSRVYLYAGEYSKAEEQATLVINDVSMYQLMPIDGAFVNNSRETIWQLQVVGADNSYGANTEEGRNYVIPSIVELGGIITFALNREFVESFEQNDQRRSMWIKQYSDGINSYYYPFKYRVGAGITTSSEYSIIMRLAEQYLIRAEARIQTNNISGGIADLNVLRNRATDLSVNPAEQLPQLPSSLTKNQALEKLEYERKAELFTEMGHRWFDLKRTHGFSNVNKTRADEILGSVKGSNWQSTDQLYPIPLPEIQRDPELNGHQNPGYQ